MNTPITSETQLSHLLDYANELAQYKADYRGQPVDFQFLPDGTMTGKPNQGDLFAASMAPVALTEHAMKQAFTKLGKVIINGKEYEFERVVDVEFEIKESP